MSKAHDKLGRAELLARRRRSTVKDLNHLFIVTVFAVDVIAASRKTLFDDANSRKALPTQVPSVDGGMLTIRKRAGKISSLLRTAVRRDLYCQALIAGVAITEDLLSYTTRCILTWYPAKLLKSAEGMDTDKAIPMKDVVLASDLESVIRKLVDKRMHDLTYGPPLAYFTYIENVLNVNIEDKLRQSFIEVKATRDLLVHAGGKVNAIYVSKSDALSRAPDGHLIPMDREYFERAFVTLKSIAVKLSRACERKYGKESKDPEP